MPHAHVTKDTSDVDWSGKVDPAGNTPAMPERASGRYLVSAEQSAGAGLGPAGLPAHGLVDGSLVMTSTAWRR